MKLSTRAEVPPARRQWSRMHTYAVPPGWTVLLRDVGLDPVAIFRRAGLSSGLVSRGDLRVDVKDYFALWRALEQECGRGDIAVRVARSISGEALDPVLLAGLCSHNLTAAAHRVSAYERVLYPALFDVDATSGLTLRLHQHGAFQPPSVMVRFELLFWVGFARLGTRERIRPVKVIMPDPPQDQTEAAEFLDGTLITQGPRAEIQFGELDARRPFLTSNEPMWRIFEPQLCRQLWDLETKATWSERVHGVLVEALPTGRRAITDVASDLHVSARTLQRHLTAEGTTFRSVVELTREHLARHYLSHTTKSDTQIALLVGYDELASFHRAFRSWTGLAPDVLRRAAI